MVSYIKKQNIVYYHPEKNSKVVAVIYFYKVVENPEVLKVQNGTVKEGNKN